ncbi:hypothetical protein GOP47_0004236 [Adiantum capillus-veneris]|uniref:Uncharacterized protein n=1 Tax=Adiantum capillus-veneris TaxID=13818 RepID=A0A9D4ZME7_ADICA|nr:hypothetical protein GOP47_0004236 [Adiantum capillus-veneris]
MDEVQVKLKISACIAKASESLRCRHDCAGTFNTFEWRSLKGNLVRSKSVWHAKLFISYGRNSFWFSGPWERQGRLRVLRL